MILPDMIIDDSDEWGEDPWNPDYLKVVVTWPGSAESTFSGKDEWIVLIEKAAIVAALEDNHGNN